MKRMDSYPQVVESKRISPWFRVNLVDTYERGIMVGLQWEELIMHALVWPARAVGLLLLCVGSY
jgi:hypothetical protein